MSWKGYAFLIISSFLVDENIFEQCLEVKLHIWVGKLSVWQLKVRHHVKTCFVLMGSQVDAICGRCSFPSTPVHFISNGRPPFTGIRLNHFRTFSPMLFIGNIPWNSMFREQIGALWSKIFLLKILYDYRYLSTFKNVWTVHFKIIYLLKEMFKPINSHVHLSILPWLKADWW